MLSYVIVTYPVFVRSLNLILIKGSSNRNNVTHSCAFSGWNECIIWLYPRGVGARRSPPPYLVYRFGGLERWNGMEWNSGLDWNGTAEWLEPR